MKTKLLLFTGLFFALTVPAQEPRFQAEAPAASQNWNLDPAYWDRFIAEAKANPPVRIGKSDFVLGGPVVEGLRFRGRADDDRSPGEKFLDLPVIRLFVPGPMPSPPESGGRYFGWRSQTFEPWISAASRPGILKGPM